MVSRAYYPPPHPHPHDGARYLPSRSCAPYYSYPERRYQLPSHDARSMTMTDPQTDETTPPRKRIAVAVSSGSPPPILSHLSWHQLGQLLFASALSITALVGSPWGLDVLWR